MVTWRHVIRHWWRFVLAVSGTDLASSSYVNYSYVLLVDTHTYINHKSILACKQPHIHTSSYLFYMLALQSQTSHNSLTQLIHLKHVKAFLQFANISTKHMILSVTTSNETNLISFIIITYTTYTNNNTYTYTFIISSRMFSTFFLQTCPPGEKDRDLEEVHLAFGRKERSGQRLGRWDPHRAI